MCDPWPQQRRALPGLLLALLAVAMLSGCSLAPVGAPTEPGPQAGPLAQCLTLFEATDSDIDQAGVRHQGLARIAAFPYLRVNRFLASFAPEVDTTDQITTWTRHLAALDARARQPELANLATHLAKTGSALEPGLATRLDECRTRLVTALLKQPRQLRQLRHNASVPDDYQSAWRVAGLYPLTAPVVLSRIRAWHKEAIHTFNQPLSQLAVVGQLTRWRAVQNTPSLNSELIEVPVDALGIPRLTTASVAQLFARHAPVWEVDVRDDNDVIGTPVWKQGPAFDTATATQYQQLSYSRFGGKVLLQLNYVIWFKARPGNDIYAGRFDGLTWRVTLGPDLQPLLYDSIHNCGCYHTFFPTASLQLRADLLQSDAEPPLVPQYAPPWPLVVRLEHRRHFIQRVYSLQDTGHGLPLVVQDYDSLLALPAEQGHHSFFGRHGLVAGSERTERFILWPMGIRSPGAMRQWGRHAVAFVGRRHFDDPDLITALFERVPGP